MFPYKLRGHHAHNFAINVLLDEFATVKKPEMQLTVILYSTTHELISSFLFLLPQANTLCNTMALLSETIVITAKEVSAKIQCLQKLGCTTGINIFCQLDSYCLKKH